MLKERERHSIGSWLHEKLIIEKFNNWFGFLVLLATGLLIAYIASTGGMDMSVVTLLAVIGIPVAILCMISLKFGFMLLVIITSFMPLTERIFYLQIRAGTYIDVFIYFLLLIALIKKAGYTKDWRFLKHPITILLLIAFGYDLLQAVNPNGNFTAWFFGVRLSFRFICIYFIAESVFQSKKDLFNFIKLWIFIALLAALYAIYQEWVGLPSFDLNWATKTPERRNLLWMGSRFRKWSFLSDVANFGLFMAFVGLMAIFMSLIKFRWWKRILLLIVGLLSLVAMVYSGTRTAYAIVPIGIAMYFLMNINKVKTLVFAVVAGMAFIFIYFAPIYNPSLTRFRSAFSPDDDPSMNVRDSNRERIQPYIWSHPFGGGLMTSGTPGEEHIPYHPLAGFPPDSGFLKSLLEIGWPGLLIQMAVFVVILGTGIRNYYDIRDPVIKGYYLAFISSFFALTIALYAKMSIDGFPMVLITMTNYVMMYRLKEFDQKDMTVTENQ